MKTLKIISLVAFLASCAGHSKLESCRVGEVAMTKKPTRAECLKAFDDFHERQIRRHETAKDRFESKYRFMH